MLQFEKVKKYYGTFLALDIPTFSLDHGLWWLKGENGSGKTTFLKLIAGLLPFNGDISINNKYSIRKQRQQFVRLVNYAEAEPLYPTFLTARDLVELYVKTKGGDINEARESLKQLNVLDAYERPLGSYSSGMIKKVSIVLAFIGEPEFILLDEPLITIDATSVETICSMINRKSEQGISFIISSHQEVNKQQLTFAGMLKAENRAITFVNE